MENENGLNKIDDRRIQVVTPGRDAWSLIKEITQGDYQEDAFYICDINDVIAQYKKWKMKMPRVEPHYVLAALGAGFDCASKEEIRKVLELGVAPSRIIFANPAKKASHIRYAAAVGVTTMTFDNENELYKIKRYFTDARMVIRIRYDDLSATYVLGNKYGCDPKTEARDLLLVARSLGIDVIGVSFHVGSGSKDNAIYAKAIEAARHVFDVAETLGFNFNFLDIGGGFPGGRSEDFYEISRSVNHALDTLFADSSIRVISEPGRYFVTSAFTLVSNIHSVKEAVETDAASGDPVKLQMYYVDVSVYGAFITVLCDEFYPPKTLYGHLDARKYPSVVWGATCDGVDKIAHNVMLPKLKIGDWIVFEDAGAYTLSIACEFNGFPPPNVHCVVDEDNWKLLRQLRTFPKGRFVVGKTMEDFFTELPASYIAEI
ncbi:hypothetical protein NQ318_005403 [Aromia moschata]|uniref:Ornithine decarboxylase n=1 Tax=Aromia moschata TaxID=1265417 RepID=A0AAV8YVL0_9CUCU|nr:hypothetical protein NQ318_005403 [Aromia moschata]